MCELLGMTLALLVPVAALHLFKGAASRMLLSMSPTEGQSTTGIPLAYFSSQAWYVPSRSPGTPRCGIGIRHLHFSHLPDPSPC